MNLLQKDIANILGITDFKSSLSPQDKANYIKELKDSGKIVVMAGDGVNDSLALSYSDVAIAMGNGADVSMMVSDIVLLSSKLSALKEAFIIF